MTLYSTYPTAQDYSYFTPHNHTLWHHTSHESFYQYNTPQHSTYLLVQDYSHPIPQNTHRHHSSTRIIYHFTPLNSTMASSITFLRFNYRPPYYPLMTPQQAPHLERGLVQNQQQIPSQHATRLVELKRNTGQRKRNTFFQNALDFFIYSRAEWYP